MLSGLLNQLCLRAAKPSISGGGITGIMPIEMVTRPGIASALEKMGLAAVSIATPLLSIARHRREHYSLSVYGAEPSIYWVAASGCAICIELECTISVFDIDFVFFNGKICGCDGAGSFSTVFAMAEVTTRFCEQVVVDCYCDATAEAVACYGILERGQVMSFRVACEACHWRANLQAESLD